MDAASGAAAAPPAETVASEKEGERVRSKESVGELGPGYDGDLKRGRDGDMGDDKGELRERDGMGGSCAVWYDGSTAETRW